MWSYYGRKWKIVSKYPEPKFDTIIEPFAGTASYSYKYWEKDVVLVDAFDKIVRIWKYLQQAQPEDILRLPDVGNMENIDGKHNWLCEEERWLIGYSINNGSTIPKKTAGRMNFNSWNRDKKRIAKDLYKIRHWKIEQGTYKDIENQSATWFIDPPYQHNKYKYGYNESINYYELGEWNKSRIGQVIVCDNFGADYMDFVPLVTLSGQRTKTLEMIWTNKDEE